MLGASDETAQALEPVPEGDGTLDERAAIAALRSSASSIIPQHQPDSRTATMDGRRINESSDREGAGGPDSPRGGAAPALARHVADSRDVSASTKRLVEQVGEKVILAMTHYL